MASRKLITYRDSGVNIDANDEMVELIKPIVRSTYGPRVMGGHGGFAGLFRLDYREDLFKKNYKEPVLVACTDGVGSKILLARESGHYDTIGIDLVAMNVNDMLTVGAEPLFFLDYVAVHKLEPARVAEIVEGIAAGCREADCALIGGETAEMPDLYAENDFDLAGFAVGAVERSRVIDGSQIEPGDVLIGLPSSGVHSNGYSLARKLVFEQAKLKYDSFVEAVGAPIGDELLKPTRIYVRPVISLLRRYRRKQVVRGMAHITGGGYAENVPRVLPKGLNAEIDTRAWQVPPIFRLIQERGGISAEEMYEVFNMGIGMVLMVAPADMDTVREAIPEAIRIGTVTAGAGPRVVLHGI